MIKEDRSVGIGIAWGKRKDGHQQKRRVARLSGDAVPLGMSHHDYLESGGTRQEYFTVQSETGHP